MFTDPIYNTFASLFLLVGVLGLVLFIVKRYAMKFRKSKPDNMGLEIISRIALQPKTHLFIIKIGNKKLLIGANEHSINTLCDLSVEAPVKPVLQNVNAGFRTKEPVKKINEHIKHQDIKEDNLSFKNFLAQTFRKQ